MNQPIYPAFDPRTVQFLTFGQILDRIYKLMRSHLRLFLGIAAVPSGALIAMFAGMAAISIPILIQSETTKSPPHGAPLYFIEAFIGVFNLLLPAIGALYLPAASYAAMQTDFGASVSFRESYRVSWSRFARHLWLMVLGSLYVIVPVAVIGGLIGLFTFLLSRSAGSSANPAAAFALVPLLMLLYLGFIVYSILVVLRFALSYPACMTEGLTAWNSLKRSAQLTRGAKGRIFLVMLVVYAAVYVANMIMVCGLMLLGVIGALIASLAHVAVPSPAFYVLVGLGALGYLLMMLVSSAFNYATFTTALAVIYHDQRRRKDAPPPASDIIPA
jgi:hypothetical protein